MSNFFKKSQTLINWFKRTDWETRSLERIMQAHEREVENLRIKTANELTHQLRRYQEEAEGAEIKRIQKEIDRLQSSLPIGSRC
jgi:hypothetical protein